MKKQIGNVYWAKSRKIDKSDKKIKRQYAVVRDNGKSVKVAKIRGYNNNPKNIERLYELDMKKYPLSKRSGVDKKIYSRRADNNRLLNLDDSEVFESGPSFKLNSHDTHGVLLHTNSIKKRRK